MSYSVGMNCYYCRHNAPGKCEDGIKLQEALNSMYNSTTHKGYGTIVLQCGGMNRHIPEFDDPKPEVIPEPQPEPCGVGTPNPCQAEQSESCGDGTAESPYTEPPIPCDDKPCGTDPGGSNPTDCCEGA